MLSRLATFSVESTSAAITLIVFAILGFSPLSAVGAVLLYFGVRAFIKSWVAERLPSPMEVLLFVLALFGLLSRTQFVVFAAVLIAVFLLKETKLVKLSPEGLLAGLKMGLLGVVAPILFLIPIIPAYEAVKKVRYDLLGAVALLVLVAVGFYGFWSSLLDVSTLEALSFGYLGYLGLGDANPLVWLGKVAYEEFVGRVTPFANAMFTLLHTPSRLVAMYDMLRNELYAVAVTAMTLLLINYGARWLYDIYQQYGILASIVGHIVYNSAVSSFSYLLKGDVLPIMVYLFLGVVGYLYHSSRRLV